MTGQSQWSLGVLIGLPVLSLVVLVLLGIIVAGLVTHNPRDPYSDGRFVASIAAGTLVGILALGAFVYFPYSSEYHKWYEVKGKVEKVDKRMIADGKSMSERYVVVVKGQPYGVDDTRAALLEVGDSVDLSCKKEYQYTANSGWACRWAGVATP